MDIIHISGPGYIREDGDDLRIGALTREAEMEEAVWLARDPAARPALRYFLNPTGIRPSRRRGGDARCMDGVALAPRANIAADRTRYS